jgi:hypothetical protein
MKLLLWGNVNYLINCAKSCYENFDNDKKTDFKPKTVEGKRDNTGNKHSPTN